ncbi:protein GUCD1-like [Stegodyphus dumicola]|uniref:protein GUCD1-like n=1 Tax=Stegodyphus dumicola TaxID=202533 RepID=UPI0015AD8FD3|nr:protein GUCD1-like [Stegodyphus dumicola]
MFAITTDGAKSMTGEKIGVTTLLKSDVKSNHRQFQQFLSEFEAEYGGVVEEDRLYLQQNLDTVSKQEGFNKSTWTIDLAYLLHKFGVRHLYATVTLGVNPGYSKEAFYLHVLNKDTQRINERFLTADANGVKVEKRSVEMEEIIDHLASGNPAIVLVNANLLYCDTCHTNKCLMKITSYCNISFSYQGHFIVLCGFDKRENKVLYRNPSVLNSVLLLHGNTLLYTALLMVMTVQDMKFDCLTEVCTMPYDSFENARKSFGTDEDVLFVYFTS